ncbi:MAG: DUF4349 domain-containing protein [Firmicutes bacterium]|nr:DUF4349 domain-containing protein [Bacillota bacterium]
MKCVKIRKLLKDYLRGQTDSQTAAAAATHLEACEDCARELAFLKTYYARIGSLETLEAPENLLLNIKQQLCQTGNGRARARGAENPGWFWFRAGKAPRIAGALTVALIVFLVSNPFQIRQKFRQDAKATQKKAPQTVAPPENRILAVKGIDMEDAFTCGEGGQITGEQRLIFTIRQPPAMANTTLARASAGGRSEAMVTEMDPKAIKEKSVSKKGQSHPALNSTVVLALKSLVKSVAGEVLQENFEEVNGQPPGLLIRIPVQKYTLFLAKLEELGSINHDGPAAPPLPPKTRGTASNSQQFVEIRLILQGIF